MGTHPIFESDFDCLTDYSICTLNDFCLDNFKKKSTNSENFHLTHLLEFFPSKKSLKKMSEREISIKTILVDFIVSDSCDVILERFTNSTKFADFGLTLQSWNVKSVAGNVLYVGSDGLSVLFQWYPANKNSGDSRLETIAHVIEEEMKKLKSQRTVLTHPLKRGLEFNPYIKNTDGTIVEYDFQELLFHQKTKYQDVKIYQTGNFGGMLVLDDDPNLAESDLPYTKAICGNDTVNYTDKTVLILGGGDGGILNYLRKNHKPKFIEMIEIDAVVLTECAKHMRKAAGDSLDSWKGENYEIFCEDCIPRLNRYKQEGKQFDVVINDLTAIPVDGSDTKEVEDLWQFLKLILTLSMAVLRSDGVYFTQGNAKNAIDSLGKYEDVLKALSPPVTFSSEEVTVPSYHEQWMFYTVKKIQQ